MDVERIAAFTQGPIGGNPAGVVLCDRLPETDAMQALAAEIGYSETVFAAPSAVGYRVRYFAPAAEIPFCGHATIALGAALARRGRLAPTILELNEGQVTVEGRRDANGWNAALFSPPPSSGPAATELLEPGLALFGLDRADLDPALPPALIEAGARHLLLALQERPRLAAMRYDMVEGARLMRAWRLATISLVHAETRLRYHARNPFAAGGVYEDPATGAAAAALAGYLKRLDRISDETIEIVQGEDMGIPCLIRADAPSEPGSPARVHGSVRWIA